MRNGPNELHPWGALALPALRTQFRNRVLLDFRPLSILL
jgi:hypothetical protein